MTGKKLRKYWMRRVIILNFLFVLAILMSPLQCFVSNALSTSRENTADAIADICIEEWPTYGILPSVAVAQAFVESGLGSGGSNLFGVNGCFGLETVLATYRYLQCLHNEFFKGKAAWKDSPEEQLYYILERGYYCEGEYPYGSYYYNVIRSIYRYGWDKYDEKLSRKLAEEDRERAQKKASRLRSQRSRMPFKILFSNNIPFGTMCTDPEYIKKGSTVILGYYIFEVTESDKGLDNSVVIGCKDEALPSLHDDILVDGLYTHLTEVIENAKG